MRIAATALAAVAALGFAACNTTPKSDVPTQATAAMPAAAAGLPPGTIDRNAFYAMVLSPNDNPVKACAIEALAQNTGLTLQRLGRAPDAQVAATLTRGVSASDQALGAHRERQIALWKQTHDPSRLAASEFDYCRQRNNVATDLGAAGTKCFSLAMIPATAEGYKAAAMTLDEARGAMLRAYGAQVQADYLTRIVDAVYAKVAQATQYEVHRQVLAACIRDVR
jgi:hypothetical protein